MRELVIEIGPGLSARLLERASGQLLSQGQISIADAERTAIEGILTAGNPAPAELEAAGLRLYAVLEGALGPTIGQEFGADDPSRIFFSISSPEMYRLPWEILRFPKPNLAGVTEIWVREAHYLSRLYSPDWSRNAPEPCPLRVLVLIGCDDADADADPTDELLAIRRAIHPVHRTIDLHVVCRPADLNALHNELRGFRPHVLHFIGHASSNPPCLEMRPNTATWDWETGMLVHIGQAMVDNWLPNLVFLNACRTAENFRGMASVASAFLERRAQATIAMQGNIKGEAAGRLAGAFYGQIACGKPVDEALSYARNSVAGIGEYGWLQANYPALTLRCHPSAVFPAIGDARGDYAARTRFCPLLPKLQFFVNQKVSRRNLYDSLWPFKITNGQLEQCTPLILVHGASGSGKTLLSAWLLDLSARMGHRVRYVRVSDPAGVDSRKIIDLIKGKPEAIPGKSSPLLRELDLDVGGTLKLNALIASDSSDPEILYDKFRLALQQLTEKVPLTLVLDDFDRKMDLGSFRVFCQYFLEYLGTSALAKVNVALLLSEDDYKYYSVKDLVDKSLGFVTDVPLNPIGENEFPELLGEYAYYRSDKLRNLIPIMKSMASQCAAEWAPLSVSSLEERVVKMTGLRL